MHFHLPGSIPTIKNHSPVQYEYPCLVPLPAGHLPRHTYLLGIVSQPCIKVGHGPVWSGGPYIHPCLVQAPAEHLPKHSQLPGAMPTTMFQDCTVMGQKLSVYLRQSDSACQQTQPSVESFGSSVCKQCVGVGPCRVSMEIWCRHGMPKWDRA